MEQRVKVRYSSEVKQRYEWEIKNFPILNLDLGQTKVKQEIEIGGSQFK